MRLLGFVLLCLDFALECRFDAPPPHLAFIFILNDHIYSTYRINQRDEPLSLWERTAQISSPEIGIVFDEQMSNFIGD